MTRRVSCATIALALAAAGCTSPSVMLDFPAGELVDLSHAYDEQTIVWPTSERFRLDTVSDGITEAGFYYAANNFFSAEHGGTHLDAPVHFARGRQSADRIPLERLMGQAVVVDVGEAAARDAGAIPPGSIVLIRTGFSARWPDAAAYLGTAERGAGAVAQLHFPGVHPDAARWLVENRSIKAIGIDTASIDFGQSTLYETHRLLSEREIPAFENLTSLDRLPARGAIVIALPMKIAGGSGAPLRAVAVLPRD